MIRLGDRAHQYAEKGVGEIGELTSVDNTVALFLYLMEQYCEDHGTKGITVYLASNGGAEYVEKVEKGIHRHKPDVKVLSEIAVLSLLEQKAYDSDDTSKECAEKMKANNMFLFSVEKEILELSTIHFHFNPKFAPVFSEIFGVFPKYGSWISNDWFLAFGKDSETYKIAVRDIKQFATTLNTDM